MLCIYLDNTDPYFCLATEEYLLKYYQDDIFMLWQSHDSVVVGKHQNAMGEINYRYVMENGIRVARRISGGGTVFHDSGNVNFTFIKNVTVPQEISFKRFTQPIVDVLDTLGIKAVTSGRNDLLVEGRKISGNAEHVFKNRVMHHGTLLYRSDLANLGHAIRVVPGRYVSRAVQSNRSVVANIAEFLTDAPPVSEFIRTILHFQLAAVAGSRLYALSTEETEVIERLALEKFKTPEWIFGYSPAYAFSRESEWKGQVLTISMKVEKGIIKLLDTGGNAYSESEQQLLESRIPGNEHDFGTLAKIHSLHGIPYDEDLIYSWF
jgi:lipoate-protein ligase A